MATIDTPLTYPTTPHGQSTPYNQITSYSQYQIIFHSQNTSYGQIVSQITSYPSTLLNIPLAMPPFIPLTIQPDVYTAFEKSFDKYGITVNGIKKLTNEQLDKLEASIQKPFNTINYAGLFSMINLVTNFGDIFIPTEISKSINQLLK
ncbi:5157_t:CDS:2, partial [Dentiscutata erythropus]